MEGRYVTVINRKSVYLRKKDIMEELGISRGTANRLVKGVEEGIKSGRYGRYCIAGNFINFYAIVDYLEYGDMLDDTNMRKYVPKFAPSEIADTCGYNTKIKEV